MATLKPQAGLIVPQAMPSSQPNPMVRSTYFCNSLHVVSSFSELKCCICSFFQGAGEPMDLGELAGMTPEIIQKVRNVLGSELEINSYNTLA